MQKDGYFLDIGCNVPIFNNNTYSLEIIGWKGICIDIESFDFSCRKAKFIQENANNTDWDSLFIDNNSPELIDYLSLDTDIHAIKILESLLKTKFKFKVITIEHDLYINGDEFRNNQREILNKSGYRMLFGDVYPDYPEKWIINKAYFEDWWVNPEFIRSCSLYEKISASEAMILLRNNLV